MNDEIFADLHNHTTASDGDFSPEQLVAGAKEKGVRVLGITDHDTLGGIEAALEAGRQHGIEVVPGVEISVRFKRPFFTGTLHVLTYFSEKMLADEGFCYRFQTLLSGGRGDGLVKARIKKINEVFGPGGTSALLDRDLAFEDISVYSDNASRRHFALALSDRFNITDKDTINQVIGNASPAYLPSGVALDDVAAFIKNEPVVAVLAHPAAGSFPGEGHYKEVLPPIETVETLLPEFLDAGVKGVEVFYPGHAKEHREQLLGWAEKFGLLVTGGSDCHDDTQRPQGVSGITQERFDLLKEAIACEEQKKK